MPTKNPRVNVVLELPLYEAISRLARRDRVSLSAKMKDLVKDALGFGEDLALADLANKRARTFARKSALSHEQAWGKRTAR